MLHGGKSVKTERHITKMKNTKSTKHFVNSTNELIWTAGRLSRPTQVMIEHSKKTLFHPIVHLTKNYIVLHFLLVFFLLLFITDLSVKKNMF